MNRKTAVELSRDNVFTNGELKAMVSKALAGAEGKTSRVNRQFTLAQACEIYARALASRADGEVMAGMVTDPYSHSGRKRPSKDSLMIANILRDCYE